MAMRNKLFATAKGVISLSSFIAVLLLFVAITSEFAYGGAWTTKTSMPAARSTAAAGVINGVLYVAGGHDGVTGGTTTLQAYNPTTDTWSTLASMPGRRYGGDGAGVINGKLYVAGGWNAPDSSLPQSQLFVYDPATNSWSSKASMPTLSGEGASGVINGKLYVTTADNGYYGWRDYLHVYDPATNTWSSLASSPNVHTSPAFGVIDGKFYVAGGSDASGTISSKLDVYDPATNTWNTKTSMPAAGAHFASGVFNGKLYAIGGNYDSGYYNTVYVYDPSADTWTTETSMPTARYGAAGGVINSVLYVAGGYNSTGTLATVEAFTFSSLPTATTGSATNATSSSATLNGTVNANGLSTTAWFNYGITSGSYSGTSTTQSVSGTSTTSLSSDISGLSASTTYYYRIAAQNSAGTSYGSETSFITSAPADTTAPTGSVSINSGASYTNSTTVTLSLSATDSVGVTGYYLSDSSTIPSASASSWTSVTSTTSYSATVSYSLSSGEGSKTIYAWYKDAAGNVSSTASATITLDTTVPTVTISSPTSSSTYTATSSTISLGGSASDSSSGISSVAWSNNRGGNGTATGTASWTVSSISLSSGDNVITVTARDGAGNSGTDTITVTYNAGSAPTVVTGSTTNVTTTSAMLTGTVNANGLSTTAWFEYGTAKGTYGNKTTTQTVTASSNISISAAISGLSSNTTYYYRVAASNSAGASYGSENSFTTITSSTPVPTPTQTLSANISNFPIATTSGYEFAVSATFDGTNYLVGIQGDQKDRTDITAQLVSQTGALVGSRISVPRNGGSPSVAFDGNNYLMVWSDDANYHGYDIYGQFISTAGTLVGTPFAINQAAGYQDQSGLRSVVFDGLNYFVVWGSAPVRDGCNDEYGQFVKPNGQLLGSPIKINQQTGCGGGGMTLTFDGTNILAVWISEWTSGGTQNGCWDSEHCESVNVVGQFITKSGEGTPGALSGDNFWISESPVSRSLPSVSFDGTNYLVVFPEDTGLPDVCGDTGCNWNISAYLLTTTGTLASSKITVTSADGQQLYPFVTFDGTNYLVTWTDMTDTTNCDIYGQYISSSGTLVGSPFPVDTDSGNQWGGFIGLPVNGKLFGIMNNNFDTLDNGTTGDVYGMLLSVGSATSPTPTPTTTVTPTPTTSPVPTPQVSPSPSNEGIVFGFVNDEDEQPLKGVAITITGKNSSDSTETDENGYYEFTGLSKGNYAITYEKEGFQAQTQDVSLNEGEVKDLGTVTMEQVVKGKISGYVTNIKGDPIESVRLKLKGVKTKVIKTASSDADGFFEFTDVGADTYVIFAKKKGYKKTQQKVVLGDGDSTEIEIEMRRTSKRIKGLIQEEDVQ